MEPPEPGGGTVLVPGIDAPSSVTCLRSLRPRDVGTIVGSEDPRTPSAASRYCDEFVRLPDPGVDVERYAAALRTVAERSDVRTVIPVREADVYALATNREALAGDVATPWPDFETLRRVQDRVELFAAAAEAGVAAPETALLDEWEDWDRDTIVKPRYTVSAPAYLGDAAGSVDVGSTEYRAPGERPDRETWLEERGHVPLVQEYVPCAEEYGFFALYDEGEAVATFQHVQHRGWKYCGGPSAFRESVRIPELERDGRALLDELEWHGLAMVEFLRDPDTGEFRLMEVNPRFWSSLPFTVRAGADFPYYYWRQAVGDPIPEDPGYEVGTAGHLLRGELSYLHSVATETYPLVERPSFASALWDVGTSLVRHPRFDYAVADDPRPFVRDALNALRAVGVGERGADGERPADAEESSRLDRPTETGTDAPTGDDGGSSAGDGVPPAEDSVVPVADEDGSRPDDDASLEADGTTTHSSASQD